MTDHEKWRFLLTIQGNKDLQGAGVVVIEGFFPQVLRWNHAMRPKIYLALYKLDAINRGWSEPAWRQNVQLHLRKVGVLLTDLAFPCVVGGEYACFPGVAGSKRTPGFGASALADSRGESQAALFQATKGMQETQMSFNLQYLQLQNSMQNENRQFTMVSNIVKAKHDTVKNSISNIH